jgi:hypothetical protein
MSAKRTALVGGILSCIVAGPSLADDYCNDILARDLGNKQTIQTNNNSSSALHQAQCIKNDSSSSNSSGTSIGGNYADVASGNYNQNGSSAQNQSSSDCSSTNAEQHASAALYYSQAIYRDVVDAWKQCMTNRQQFACWVTNSGSEEHLTIHARWNKLSAQPKVIRSSIRVGNNPTRPAFNVGDRLYLNDNLVDVDRNKNEDVVVTIQASSDATASDSCEVFVPSSLSIRPADTVITAQFQVQSPIGVLPPPNQCSCLSEGHPTSPDNRPPPHDPFPGGSLSRFVNNCSNDISIFQILDTVPASMMQQILQPAPGRKFSYQTLRPGQTLLTNLTGVVAGIGAASGCPQSSTITPALQGPPPPPPPFLCVSNTRITPTAIPGQPRVCAAQGPPGSPCNCQEGSVAHQGINWIGPVPAP